MAVQPGQRRALRQGQLAGGLDLAQAPDQQAELARSAAGDPGRGGGNADIGDGLWER